MEHCPRCSEIVEPGWAYCPLCGRSRILESLRSPSRVAKWHREVLNGLVVGFAIWLVVTFAVAFFREAKAVRDARRLLEGGEPQAAWQALDPFLQSHPHHKQALFLCVEANVKLGNPAKAGECLDSAPTMAAKLEERLGPLVAQQAAAASCDSATFEKWFELAEKLGEEKVKDVERALIALLPKCSGIEEPSKMFAFLVQKNRAMEMVSLVFVPLIEGQDNDWAARELAEEAVKLAPEGKEAIDAAMERRRERDQ
jgi:hypothetical protein